MCERRTISGGSCESQAVCMKYVNGRDILGSVSPVRNLHLTLKWDRMVSDGSRLSLSTCKSKLPQKAVQES